MLFNIDDFLEYLTKAFKFLELFHSLSHATTYLDKIYKSEADDLWFSAFIKKNKKNHKCGN